VNASAPPARGVNEANISTKQQAKEEDARIPHPHEQSRRTPGPEETTRQRAQATDSRHSGEATQVAGGETAPRRRSQRFPRTLRLRKRSEFLAVQRRGKRQTVPHFVVITRRKKNAPSRLGITTSKKVGNAPERNRVRRLVREVFRRRGSSTPASDVVVIARAGAAKLTYHEVAEELSRALAPGPELPRQ